MLEWILWLTAILLSSISIGVYLRYKKTSDVLVSLYVLFLAMAQIVAVKLITVGNFIIPASIFIVITQHDATGEVVVFPSIF